MTDSIKSRLLQTRGTENLFETGAKSLDELTFLNYEKGYICSYVYKCFFVDGYLF